MMGNKVLDMDLIDKMNYIDSIINNHFTNNYCSNFIFKINKFYKYENLDKLIKNIIPKCDIEILGLIFFPNKSGITTIYMEKKIEKVEIENTDYKVDNKSYDLIKDIHGFLNKRTYSYEKGKKIKLYIDKTNITDVYNLYKDNERIGIAHVPNMKTSLYLNENINEKKQIYCVFNKKFNKYIPIKLV